MITIKNPGVVIKLTTEEAINLGISPTEEKQLGEMKTYGAWNIPTSFKALCTSSIFDKKMGYTERSETKLYGLRTLSKVRQGSYELEGYVSIKGKKYSAFTSSQMFEVEGKLIDVCTIHARVR